MRTIILVFMIVLTQRIHAPIIEINICYTNIQNYLFELEIFKILKTIKIIESNSNYECIGLSGEYGAYQIMPATWNIWCFEFFGKVLEPTPANQDTIVYLKIKQWLEKQKSIEEIAMLWNAGTTMPKRFEGINKFGVYFNVNKYVEKFLKIYKTLSYERNVK